MGAGRVSRTPSAAGAAGGLGVCGSSLGATQKSIFSFPLVQVCSMNTMFHPIILEEVLCFL